jgi:hypothetical protein
MIAYRDARVHNFYAFLVLFNNLDELNYRKTRSVFAAAQSHLCFFRDA